MSTHKICFCWIQWRQFVWNVKSCYLEKIRKNISKYCLLKILPRVLMIKTTQIDNVMKEEKVWIRTNYPDSWYQAHLKFWLITLSIVRPIQQITNGWYCARKEGLTFQTNCFLILEDYLHEMSNPICLDIFQNAICLDFCCRSLLCVESTETSLQIAQALLSCCMHTLTLFFI